jgi:quercetin dioxygenase-like cupin family protein
LTEEIHVKAWEGNRVMSGDIMATIHKLSGDQTEGTFAVAEHHLEPGYLAAPMHVHAKEHEASYILEGEFTFIIGDDEIHAGPGDFVFKPKGIPHTFWNSGDKKALLLEIFSPAGFEKYFDELEPLLETENVDFVAVGELAEKYGLELRFESMPELSQKYGVKVPGT